VGEQLCRPRPVVFADQHVVADFLQDFSPPPERSRSLVWHRHQKISRLGEHKTAGLGIAAMPRSSSNASGIAKKTIQLDECRRRNSYNCLQTSLSPRQINGFIEQATCAWLRLQCRLMATVLPVC